MTISRVARLIVALVLVYGIGYELIWRWGVCRVYVPEGKSLLVRYKGNLLWRNPPMAEGDFARVDDDGHPQEVGILRDMVGPGRHFHFDPIHFEREIVDDVVIDPGSVGVVTCKLGKDLPAGQFLVDGDVGATAFKGVLRKVLKPGRYRVNKYGYDVTVVKAAPNDNVTGKHSGWVEIPAGYVGVVTHLTNDPDRGITAGIQDEVLQAGLYAVNPHEEQIDIVLVGYRATTIASDLMADQEGKVKLDDNGEPILKADGENKGILFPSNDGFTIHLDFTCVWGLMPEQAPRVISLFGNVDVVEQTVILPEIESICRIHGSKLGAVELLVGDSREDFQRQVSEDFRSILTARNLSMEVGLIRHIYIPAEVRGPIQKANIAGEVKLTRDVEIETARIEGQLEETKSSIEREEQTVISETEKLYQEQMALGRKSVQELMAETDKLVAGIARKTAELDAQAKLALGEADSEVERLKRESEAQKFDLAVKAFGSSDSYNDYVFATGLPESIELNLFYAGEGTFWTDLKGMLDVQAARQLRQGQAPAEKPTPPKPTSPRK